VTLSIPKKIIFSPASIQLLKGSRITKGKMSVNYLIENHKIKMDNDGHPIVKEVETGDEGVIVEKIFGINDIVVLCGEVVNIDPGMKIYINPNNYIITKKEGVSFKRKGGNLLEVIKGVSYINIHKE
jgi:hypothetical protein